MKDKEAAKNAWYRRLPGTSSKGSVPGEPHVKDLNKPTSLRLVRGVAWLSGTSSVTATIATATITLV
jgi:hypothetical protein